MKKLLSSLLLGSVLCLTACQNDANSIDYNKMTITEQLEYEELVETTIAKLEGYEYEISSYILDNTITLNHKYYSGVKVDNKEEDVRVHTDKIIDFFKENGVTNIKVRTLVYVPGYSEEFECLLPVYYGVYDSETDTLTLE